jgi:flagellar biosynthesis protein FlhG
VVATPEPTSITDAYATMKVLSQNHGVKTLRLIVNQVSDRAQALKVYRYLTNVADQFLNVSIEYLGHVPRDPSVNQAIMRRKLVIDMLPESPASVCVGQLVDELIASAEDCPPTGNMQFFWQRLLKTGS